MKPVLLVGPDEDVPVVVVVHAVDLPPVVVFGLREGRVEVVVVPSAQRVEKTLVSELVNHL